MKIVAALLVISLGFLALAQDAEECPRPCLRTYRPVCAEWRRGPPVSPKISRCTFTNQCIVDNKRCRNHQNWVTVDWRSKCRSDTPDCDELRQSS
ncbi:uncharacterized protein LOC26527040 [Drosophila erecta]|uniref:uncharacterized protein LOC26527040 n=1 Tax=Drosophila erecta TaxID=7220 RepID=UPI0007327115|nr:uncharacterized protein LOC26527040 [Drosophila erecta]KQS38874.1 uncharacterized protein Dere_GG27216 [Drosophila erecta]